MKVHKIKSRRRGNQLLGYEFTFQKKALKTGLMTNLIIQKIQKCSPGSKTPDWYDPNYKNATTSEEQKELERLKKNCQNQ